MTLKGLLPPIFFVMLLYWINPLIALSGVDNTLYRQLLAEYVHEGVVDYKGFKKDEKKLDAYLELLKSTNIQTLSADEQYAFYVNAYNAWTIKLILGGYPGVKSIKDLGSILKSPWKKEIVQIGGKVLTLDQVEHDILRANFKDPRVHAAVNCASKSCPPLLSEPFEGYKIDQQLNDAMQAFINDSSMNYVKGHTLYVSRIFKWFAGDFNNDVVGYFQKFAQGELQQKLLHNPNRLKVKYLKYDWTLNGS
jgi:hypothetical protein